MMVNKADSDLVADMEEECKSKIFTNQENGRREYSCHGRPFSLRCMKKIITIGLICFIISFVFIFSSLVYAKAAVKDMIAEPIKDAKTRVTKKPFRIKVSPGNSPINPEKFSGYHTGVDFETTASEQNKDVPVYALCNGNLLLKEQATGYGGVAVQKCSLNGQIVTIIYGHLKLQSVKAKVGAKLVAGTQIGILGKGYSQETGGERKHLHLGIHKGASINILGYVKNKADLSGWLDVMKFL